MACCKASGPKGGKREQLNVEWEAKSRVDAANHLPALFRGMREVPTTDAEIGYSGPSGGGGLSGGDAGATAVQPAGADSDAAPQSTGPTPEQKAQLAREKCRVAAERRHEDELIERLTQYLAVAIGEEDDVEAMDRNGGKSPYRADINEQHLDHAARRPGAVLFWARTPGAAKKDTPRTAGGDRAGEAAPSGLGKGVSASGSDDRVSDDEDGGAARAAGGNNGKSTAGQAAQHDGDQGDLVSAEEGSEGDKDKSVSRRDVNLIPTIDHRPMADPNSAATISGLDGGLTQIDWQSGLGAAADTVGASGNTLLIEAAACGKRRLVEAILDSHKAFSKGHEADWEETCRHRLKRRAQLRDMHTAAMGMKQLGISSVQSEEFENTMANKVSQLEEHMQAGLRALYPRSDAALATEFPGGEGARRAEEKAADLKAMGVKDVADLDMRNGGTLEVAAALAAKTQMWGGAGPAESGVARVIGSQTLGMPHPSQKTAIQRLRGRLADIDGSLISLLMAQNDAGIDALEAARLNGHDDICDLLLSPKCVPKGASRFAAFAGKCAGKSWACEWHGKQAGGVSGAVGAVAGGAKAVKMRAEETGGAPGLWDELRAVYAELEMRRLRAGAEGQAGVTGKVVTADQSPGSTGSGGGARRVSSNGSGGTGIETRVSLKLDAEAVA